jgi:hypothetical protein
MRKSELEQELDILEFLIWDMEEASKENTDPELVESFKEEIESMKKTYDSFLTQYELGNYEEDIMYEPDDILDDIPISALYDVCCDY